MVNYLRDTTEHSQPGRQGDVTGVENDLNSVLVIILSDHRKSFLWIMREITVIKCIKMTVCLAPIRDKLSPHSHISHR